MSKVENPQSLGGLLGDIRLSGLLVRYNKSMGPTMSNYFIAEAPVLYKLWKDLIKLAKASERSVIHLYSSLLIGDCPSSPKSVRSMP